MMAEAEGGAPRKTTTYKDFSGMNSQDGRYGVERDEFFFLENIMRVADGKLHSVNGPSTSPATFPPGDETVMILVSTAWDYLVSNANDYLTRP